MPAPVASGWSESPGGPRTHWKAPPCHGAHPWRSVDEFVTDLVDCLFEEVGVEQGPQLVRSPRQQHGWADHVEVALQEGGAHGEVPETCPRLQGGEVFRTHSPRVAEQGRVGGVMEGSQHPGDVPEGRPLEPSDTKRSRRLPFEVDNHEVVARVEHLPEVVVAVATDVDRFDLPVARQPEPVANLLLT